MALRMHPEVRNWLEGLEDEHRAEVDEALSYLEEFGRSAAEPDVSHRIQTSRHLTDMSEVRVRFDDNHIYRVLVGFDPDDLPVLLAAGNKAGIGNQWYVTNVPLADERFDIYLRALEKSKRRRSHD